MDTDLVPVWANADGRPRRFEWRGRSWLVCGHPASWIDQAPWWVTAAQPGTTPTPQQKMWRVTGLNTSSGEVVTVDLAVEEANWWRLIWVHE